MPTADYSSYHQLAGTGADGTKFDNFIDAVQATVNGLDKNNLAAAAGILPSQLADPTTGKVLGSTASACAAVFPPGYEYDYKEISAAVTVAAGGSGTMTTVVTSDSVTFDGSPVWVEFYAPLASTGTTAGGGVVLELFQDATDLGVLAQVITPAAAIAGAPVREARRLTPSAGAHTFTVKGWVSGGGTAGSVSAGVGGASVYLAAYIRVTKA